MLLSRQNFANIVMRGETECDPNVTRAKVVQSPMTAGHHAPPTVSVETKPARNL